jgi:hypothetical protein
VQVDHWAYDYINTATTLGWITGYDDGLFKPDDYISRAEVVTLTNRAMGRFPDNNFIDNYIGPTRFIDVPSNHWAFYHIMEAYLTHDYIKHDGYEEWMEANF